MYIWVTKFVVVCILRSENRRLAPAVDFYIKDCPFKALDFFSNHTEATFLEAEIIHLICQFWQYFTGTSNGDGWDGIQESDNMLCFFVKDLLLPLSVQGNLAGNVAVLDIVRSWFWRHVFVSSRHVCPTRPTCRRHHVMSGSFFLCRMSCLYLIADMLW